MTPQKLEVIKRFESGTSQSCYDFIQHLIVHCLWYNITEGQTVMDCIIKWMCEASSQGTDIAMV